MGGTLGTAVIGVGMYGQVHVRTYQDDPRTELKCVWSRTEANAKRVADAAGVPHVKDIRRIADDSSIDVVSIATPDFAHVEPALMMLEAGKHVLLEKPMATNTAECRRIEAAADKASGLLMVNFHNRWYPPLTKAMETVASGELGAPTHARIQLSDRIDFIRDKLTWAGKSAPHWFLMSHTMDLARFVFGLEAEKAFAFGHKGVLAGMGIDTWDTVSALVQFEGGVPVHLENSWIIPEGWRNNIIEFGAQFYCEKGRIQVFGDNEGISIASEKEHRTPLLYDFITEEFPIRHFIKCIVDGTKPEWGTARDGVMTTAAVEAVDRSLTSGTTVDVKSILDESAQAPAKVPAPAAKDAVCDCPTCGKPMVRREGKYGPFLGCTGYPDCKQTLKLDKDGNPVKKT